MRKERLKSALDRLIIQLATGTKPEKIFDEKSKTRKTTGQTVKLTDDDINRIKAEIDKIKTQIERA